MRRHASPLFLQGIAQAIAIHLARNYAGTDGSAAAVRRCPATSCGRSPTGWRNTSPRSSTWTGWRRRPAKQILLQPPVQERAGRVAFPLSYSPADGRGTTPAPRDEEERGGNRPGRGLRQSQPFRTTLPPGNGPPPERLPPAEVKSHVAANKRLVLAKMIIETAINRAARC